MPGACGCRLHLRQRAEARPGDAGGHQAVPLAPLSITRRSAVRAASEEQP